MKISFKDATTADLIAVQALARKIWHEWYAVIISKSQIDYMLEQGYTPESLQKQMTTENQQFTLAYIDDVLVGYASVNTSDGKSYFLHKFYMDTAQHGKGIGKIFFEYLEEKYSPEIITLRVNRCNFKAINFYFRIGFFIEKVDTKEIGQGYKMEDFIMIKKNYE